MKRIIICLGVIFAFAYHQAIAQVTSLVSVGSDGKLLYATDSKGNKVPDFSGVGYMNSEAPIPYVPVVKTVYAVSGDNKLNVQQAIDSVAARTPDANGFRGAILFKAGQYNISDTIKINASGIVLRGEGTATNFIATKTAQYSLFYFAGSSGLTYLTSSKKAITDAYVPYGTKQITVAPNHSFQAGDQVAIYRVPKQSWIDLLTMAQWGWTYNTYDIFYERKVTSVNGNVLTLDAPMVDIIDTAYANAYVYKYSSARTEKCGIENMRISSTYVSETDENHGWEAVTFFNIINSWAKNLDVYYFGYAAVHVLDGASFITVDSCNMFDPKSLIDGGRRYSFNIDGQRCLVQNCFTRNGRHDYVDGSRTPGPNVFYNCTATLQNADIGPHHRWSTGILFDNITGDGQMAVQNRTSSGSGHGWSGAQTMFWNCSGNKLVLQDPQSDMTNWAVGSVFATVTNVGDMTTEPLGIVESNGTKIAAIPSLFMKQLKERLYASKQNQSITFPSISVKTLSTADFNPGATASSGLAITYTSSNTSVATIVNGLIHIVGSGTTIITATQDGELYTLNEAAPVSQPLIVTPVYKYVPSSVTNTLGSSCKCTIGNLVSNNGSYHVVSSTTTGTRKTDWYGSVKINQPTSSITKMTINYDGSYTITKTQTLYLYNWVSNSWSLIDSRSVATADVTIIKQISPFDSYVSSDGDIRVRVLASSTANTFKCRADWMQIDIESTSLASRLAKTSDPKNGINAELIENPDGTEQTLRYDLIEDQAVSISILDAKGTLVKRLIEKEIQHAGRKEMHVLMNELKPGKYKLEIQFTNKLQQLSFEIKNKIPNKGLL